MARLQRENDLDLRARSQLADTKCKELISFFQRGKPVSFPCDLCDKRLEGRTEMIYHCDNCPVGYDICSACALTAKGEQVIAQET